MEPALLSELAALVAVELAGLGAVELAEVGAVAEPLGRQELCLLWRDAALRPKRPGYVSK